MKTSFSLTHVAKQMPDSVVITDVRGRVEWINPAFTRLSGYTLKDLKGKKPGPILQGPASDPAVCKALHQAIHRRRKIFIEQINYHKKKWPYSVWIMITPLKNRGGHLTGFIAVERETTALQHQFRKLEDDISTLYDIICHLATGQTARDGPTAIRP